MVNLKHEGVPWLEDTWVAPVCPAALVSGESPGLRPEAWLPSSLQPQSPLCLAFGVRMTWKTEPCLAFGVRMTWVNGANPRSEVLMNFTGLL